MNKKRSNDKIFEVQKKIERKEKKIREEKLKNDHKRQEMIQEGKIFLCNINLHNPNMINKNKLE